MSKKAKETECGIIVNGVLRTLTLTYEERGRYPGYVPVDKVDYSKTETGKGNYIIEIQPYRNGDRISFRYTRKLDKTAIQKDINSAEVLLKETDYKVIKCYEASLAGEPSPYDMKTLHKQRDEWRVKINELEELLK